MTIGELCEQLVKSGECQNYSKIKFRGKELFACIGECEKLDKFVSKYFFNDDDCKMKNGAES